MKKLLVSLMIGAMLLAGCAGMQVTKAEVTADYYLTSCNEEGYETTVMNLDVDIPLVQFYAGPEENPEEWDVDVAYVWRDECNNAYALKYVEKVNGGEMCAIVFFAPEDFNAVMTDKYNEVQPAEMMGVQCERLDSTLAQQLAQGFKKWN